MEYVQFLSETKYFLLKRNVKEDLKPWDVISSLDGIMAKCIRSIKHNGYVTCNNLKTSFGMWFAIKHRVKTY
jgi:hypothetical protein